MLEEGFLCGDLKGGTEMLKNYKIFNVKLPELVLLHILVSAQLLFDLASFVRTPQHSLLVRIVVVLTITLTNYFTSVEAS